MDRVRLWLLIAVAVALAAFVTGLLRGVTDTVPGDLGPVDDSRSMSLHRHHPIS